MSVEITIKRWDHDNSIARNFKQITQEIMARSLEIRGVKTVSIIDGDRDAFVPKESKDNFNIIVWGKPHRRDEAGMRTPKKLWDKKMSFCEDCGYLFEPSGEGLVIVDPTSGYAVAEIVKNDLFILFQLHVDSGSNHIQDDVRYEIYRIILNEAVLILGSGFPTLAEMLSGRENLPEIGKLRFLYADLPRYRKDISLSLNHAIELESQFRKLTKDGSPSDAVIKRIASIPEVKSIAIESGKMIITTNTMYGEDPDSGQNHEYGEFKITLRFGEGNDEDASFVNLTRRPFKDEWGTYGHPHVDRGQRGHWCQGEGQGILRLLRDFEFEAAVLFAIKAIDSVNDDPNGNYLRVLRAFPKVAKRPAYPKKEAELTSDTIRAFAGIFNKTKDNTLVKLEEGIKKARMDIRVVQRQIVQATLAQTVVKLCGAVPKNGKIPNSAKRSISEFLKAKLDGVKQIDGVKSASVKEDVVTVKMPAFDIEFDYQNGAVRFNNGTVKELEEISLGQLSATLPELLGGVDIETATNLCLGLMAETKT